MNLIIDNRENELCKYLDQNNISYSKEQLDLGDIVFKNGDDTILTIERKTVNDLKASICDGRHREQKARLISSNLESLSRVMYLIEGNLDLSLDETVSGIPVGTLVGSLINTQLRDNIKVYKTRSLSETGQFVIKLCDKLNKDCDSFFNDENQKRQSYTSSLKLSKKANMTPVVWYRITLCQIPQVTEKIAEAIIEKYPTLLSLVAEHSKAPEHLRDKLVADLTFELKNGKQRRIGDKISLRIFTFLSGIEEEN